MWRLRKLNVRRNHSRLDDAPRIPASRPLTTCFIPQTTHASSLQIDPNRIHYDVWRHCTEERLRQKLQSHVEPPRGKVADAEPAIALSTRAGPLLDILKRASAANVPVMWEQV